MQPSHFRTLLNGDHLELYSIVSISLYSSTRVRGGGGTQILPILGRGHQDSANPRSGEGGGGQILICMVHVHFFQS